MRLRRQIQASRPLVEAMQEMAAGHGVEPAQVALNWFVNAHGEAVVAIPGASKTYQAEENAGAMHFRLSGEELHRLDELSRPFARHPIPRTRIAIDVCNEGNAERGGVPTAPWPCQPHAILSPFVGTLRTA